MFNRRRFLEGKLALAGARSALQKAAAEPVARGLLFKELGVREFINAAEPFTALTGSLMPVEAQRAWDYAAPKYVRLDELHDAVGRRIAATLRFEAAMVTSGAASALTLGTAR